MYGLLKPNFGSLTEQQERTYRAYACTSCNALYSKHGLAARALLTHELTFIALIHGALTNTTKIDFENIGCRYRHHREKKLNDASCEEINGNVIESRQAELLSYIGIESIYIKLLDKIVDSRYGDLVLPRMIKPWKKICGRYASASTVSDPFELISLQQKIELSSNNLSSISFPTQKFIQNALDGLAANYNTCWSSEVSSKAIAEYLIIKDAVDDLSDDRAKKKFNALEAIFGKHKDDAYLLERGAGILRDRKKAIEIEFDGLPDTPEKDILLNIVGSLSVKRSDEKREIKNYLHYANTAIKVTTASLMVAILAHQDPRSAPILFLCNGPTWSWRSPDSCEKIYTGPDYGVSYNDGCGTSNEYTSSNCSNTQSYNGCESIHTNRDACGNATSVTRTDACGRATSYSKEPCGMHQPTPPSSGCGSQAKAPSSSGGGGAGCIIGIFIVLALILIYIILRILAWIAVFLYRMFKAAWHKPNVSIYWSLALGIPALIMIMVGDAGGVDLLPAGAMLFVLAMIPLIRHCISFKTNETKSGFSVYDQYVKPLYSRKMRTRLNWDDQPAYTKNLSYTAVAYYWLAALLISAAIYSAGWF